MIYDRFVYFFEARNRLGIQVGVESQELFIVDTAGMQTREQADVAFKDYCRRKGYSNVRNVDVDYYMDGDGEYLYDPQGPLARMVSFQTG